MFLSQNWVPLKKPIVGLKCESNYSQRTDGEPDLLNKNPIALHCPSTAGDNLRQGEYKKKKLQKVLTESGFSEGL